ncbi:hypothetical protein [Streptomyces malaysiensis]|uniref:hypothetical protein n=1 Tax=Streptomyces malaysiensis TaxID=92644 RepID=UPI002B2DEC67|nr:hypothetical protein R8789_06985 [Streptomyces malaysiensis]
MSHAHTNPHTDTYAHPHAHTDAHHADTVPNAHPQPVRHADAHTHTHADLECHSRTHPGTAGPLPHAHSAAPRAGAHTRAGVSAPALAPAHQASGITPHAGSRTDQDPCRRDARVSETHA